jgi:hypothetical protein
MPQISTQSPPITRCHVLNSAPPYYVLCSVNVFDLTPHSVLPLRYSQIAPVKPISQPPNVIVKVVHNPVKPFLYVSIWNRSPVCIVDIFTPAAGMANTTALLLKEGQ